MIEIFIRCDGMTIILCCGRMMHLEDTSDSVLSVGLFFLDQVILILFPFPIGLNSQCIIILGDNIVRHTIIGVQILHPCSMGDNIILGPVQ